MGGTAKTATQIQLEKELSKPWYQSTTIWLNVVPILVVLLDAILQTNMIHDKDLLAIVVATANILNRLRTAQRINL